MVERREIPVPAGRAARLWRLGAMTAGVAGNMAVGGLVQLGQGQRPRARDLLLTPANITRITEQLAQMRGAAMKIGQMMSMDTGDVLPPELAQIMARLRDDAHVMPPRQLKSVLSRNWRADWLAQFAQFDTRPIAAASIGQVHRARLRDGRDLAIKVQYPGVADSIDSDVANVGALIRASGLVPRGFDIAPYLVEARAQLHDETDYLREAAALSRFHGLLEGDHRFILPHLHPDWTTGQVLAMSYLAGQPVEAAADQPAEIRNRLASDLLDLVLTELLQFGVMQTDPNFANYRFAPETGRAILLDFGAVREINQDISRLYRAFLTAGLAGDRDGLHALSLRIGFFAVQTAPHHQEAILNMMALVFDTLRQPVLDFAATDLPQRLQAAGLVLAESGFVPPPVPVEALFLQRKFGGIFLLCARLRAQVAVRALIERRLAATAPLAPAVSAT